MNTPIEASHVAALPDLISQARFSTYLRAAGGDPARALALYQWNLQVASALMVPLHVLEVLLRNAVSEAISNQHGEDWPLSAGFTRSLPDPAGPHYSPKQDLLAVARRHPSTGSVIADLKFVFWERMLTRRHDARLWDKHFLTAFPHAPRTRPVSSLRDALRGDIERIRILRNRVAHHEPIFARVLQDDHRIILRAISWRSPIAADWARSMSGVDNWLARRPV